MDAALAGTRGTAHWIGRLRTIRIRNTDLALRPSVTRISRLQLWKSVNVRRLVRCVWVGVGRRIGRLMIGVLIGFVSRWRIPEALPQNAELAYVK